jgi:diguanylate cyclase (GGDEF)-like protein
MSQRILVVEDDEDNRRLISELVTSAGYELIEAVDGEQGVALAAQHNPDLILLDVMMPKVDGYEVCRRLKQDPATADIPIIFITAHGDVEEETRGLELGAVDYIAKPINRPAARARIRNHLELKQARDKLGLMAATDGLTGLANRRHFDSRLAVEFNRLCRSGGLLSVIMIDVDHFKAFNDAYGHVLGDDCLRRIADAIGRSLRRAGDLAARYGGEEFACILPDTDEPSALTIADAVHATIAALGIPHSGSATASHVTASVGLATMRCVVGRSPLDAVAAADVQLYAAKAGGRNRISATSIAGEA